MAKAKQLESTTLAEEAKAPPTHREDPLLSLKEAAAMIGVDERTIHRWATQHGRRRIKSVRFPSGRRKIRQSVVNQIMSATGHNGDATEEIEYGE